MIDIDRLNQVQCILAKRYQDTVGGGELFDIKTDNPTVVNQLVEELWNRIVSENRIDTGQKQPKELTVRQHNMVFEESIPPPPTFAKSVQNGFAVKFSINCNFLIIFQILVLWKQKPA